MQAMKSLLPLRKLLTEKPSKDFVFRENEMWPKFATFAMWFSRPTEVLAIETFTKYVNNPDATYGKFHFFALILLYLSSLQKQQCKHGTLPSSSTCTYPSYVGLPLIQVGTPKRGQPGQ